MGTPSLPPTGLELGLPQTQSSSHSSSSLKGPSQSKEQFVDPPCFHPSPLISCGDQDAHVTRVVERKGGGGTESRVRRGRQGGRRGAEELEDRREDGG